MMDSDELSIEEKDEHNFKLNQKVKALKDIKNDGTFPEGKRGDILIKAGQEGYIKEISEFLFRPAIMVHFLKENRVIGFRPSEIELIEDFDELTGEWISVNKETNE